MREYLSQMFHSELNTHVFEMQSLNIQYLLGKGSFGVFLPSILGCDLLPLKHIRLTAVKTYCNEELHLANLML